MPADTRDAPRRLVYVPLDEISSALRNPKRHDQAAISRSFDRFGYVEPVVVDERTGRLVAGHGRLEQLRQAQAAGDPPPDGITVDPDGRWQVPVVRGWASGTDADADGYLIGSNRLVELGGWDETELAELLADVYAADSLLAEAAGFDEADLSRLLALAKGAPESRTDPDDAPDAPAVPVSKPGDVWLLGPHRVICGDSTDPAVLAALMGDDRADCVWTDPPYGADVVNIRRKRGEHGRHRDIANDELTGDALTSFLAAGLRPAFDLTRAGAAVYVAMGDGGLPSLLPFLAVSGIYRQLIIWEKDQLVLSRSDYHFRHEVIAYGWKPGAAHHAVEDRSIDTIWAVPRPKRSEEHPTMKPVELITRALSNSTHFGATVLDPFGGSGSTLIACHTTSRIARLVELDPAYCDVICRRYEAHVGVVPILESTGDPHSFVEKVEKD